jgi:hypothetical protein
MAAIDRLVHHSVILDMMSVESYRAEVANQQHQSSDRPKKSSSKQPSLAEAATHQQISDGSSMAPSQGSGTHGRMSEPVPTALLLPDNDHVEDSSLEAPNRHV